MKTRALLSRYRCYHTIHPRPLGSYYDLLLTQPLPYTPTHTGLNQTPPSNQDLYPPASTPATQPYSPNKPSNADEQAEREARARAVFGSREWTSGVQRETAREKGKIVAGVYIPPRPVEPDNCCMSGCVNCVLSQFVDELDEWKMAKRKAEMALKAQESGKKTKKKGETEEGLWEGYEDIPVGLRVFMETEKRLKGKAGKVPA